MFRGARRNILKGGGLKFSEKYFALTKAKYRLSAKVQATLFTVTFMSYPIFQF